MNTLGFLNNVFDDLSDKQIAQLDKCSELIDIKKNTVLDSNTLFDYLYILIEGVAIMYMDNSVFSINYTKNDFLYCGLSLFCKKDQIYYRFIKNGFLIRINLDKLDKSTVNLLKATFCEQKTIEYGDLKILRSLNNEEKIQWIVKYKPILLDLINEYQLAQYLKMSKRTFIRVKKCHKSSVNK